MPYTHPARPVPALEPAVSEPRRPDLERLYHRYLETEQTAGFIQAVSQTYLLSTLERLARGGRHVTRRAAIMALGFLGDFSQSRTLGRALHDRDRGVRLLADNGIRQLWRRDGSASQQHKLARVMRLNNNEQYAEAIREATELIDEAPWFAEVWNQRAIGYFARQQFEDAANDCHQTLELNAYHFGAAVGMAHCYLQLDEPFAALENFHRALRLNPDLEDVKGQIETIERSLKGN
jgi:tetratricopeptide (TPR) repeat protein